jgi:hypothetical protein
LLLRECGQQEQRQPICWRCIKMNIGIALGIPFNTKVKPSIVKNGLLLWYEGKNFKNSPPTTTWQDESGLGNNSTPTNFAYTSASGSDDKGNVFFDGVDDYSITAPIQIKQDKKVTLEAFVYPTAFLATQYGAIIAQTGPSGSYGGYWLGLDQSGKVRIFGGDTYNNGILSNNAIPLNKWIHLVAKFDGTNMAIYINGVLASGLLAITQPPNVTAAVKIGFSNSSNERFKGYIKSIRIYNRDLSDAEILQNYNAMR